MVGVALGLVGLLRLRRKIGGAPAFAPLIKVLIVNFEELVLAVFFQLIVHELPILVRALVLAPIFSPVRIEAHLLDKPHFRTRPISELTHLPLGPLRSFKTAGKFFVGLHSQVSLF